MSSTRFRLFPWFKTDDTQKATTVAHRPSYGDYVLSRLPQELERYVFEMSCQDDVRHARMLSQVAQRVRIWVSPFVKEHVLLDAPDYDRSVRQLMRDVSKHPPPEFYVGSIMIPYNLKIPDAIVFLRSYRKLQSLACWIKKEHSGDMQNLWAALNEHAPEKLSIRLWGLFRQSDEVDWSAPLFQSVTHLEIVDSHRVWLDWRGLAGLPKLTYLSLYSDLRPEGQCLIAVKDAVMDILENSPRMEVLGMNASHTDDRRVFEVFDEVTDPRLVFYRLRPHGRVDWAWNCHARGMPDLYNVLAAFVASNPTPKSAKDRWCDIEISPTALSRFFDRDSSKCQTGTAA